MASRVAEVVYKLKDLFTGPIKKIEAGYSRLRGSSRKAANQVGRDSKRMGAALGALSGKVKAFVGVFAGGLVAGGASNTIGALADELDRLGKTADRLDLDPNTLAAFEFAAERSGLAASKMTAAIETLQKRAGEAVQGIGRAKLAFDKLGLSAEEFIKLDAEQQFALLADGISQLANEEERAAVAAQLFSKANIDLLQVLDKGSATFKTLIAEGKAYRTVTEEQTKAAAEYNDALTNLQTRIDGIKFEKLTPGIEAAAKSLDKFQERDRLNGLVKDLIELNQAIARSPFERNLRFDTRSTGQLQSEIFRVKQEIFAFTSALKENEEQQSEQQRELAASAKVTEEYNAELKALTGTYEDRLSGLTTALNKETSELEKARRDQLAIEKEFNSLVSDITREDLSPEDVSLGDVFLKQRQAAAAAERGEGEEAIRLAREGGDLLGLLKQKGSETSGTLKFLAEQLSKVAKEASADAVDQEALDVDKVKASFAAVQQQADILKQTAPQAGSEYALAFLDAMRAEIEKTTLPAPRIEQPQVSAAVPKIVNGVATDGTDYRGVLDKQGSK